MWPLPKTSTLSNSNKSWNSLAHISRGAAPNLMREKVKYLLYACCSVWVSSHRPNSRSQSRQPSSRSGGSGGSSRRAGPQHPGGPWPSNAPVHASTMCTRDAATVKRHVTRHSNSNAPQHSAFPSTRGYSSTSGFPTTSSGVQNKRMQRWQQWTQCATASLSMCASPQYKHGRYYMGRSCIRPLCRL